MTSPQAMAGFMQRGFAPTTLTAVPLFHVSGLHAQLLISLRHGRRLVFMRRWDPARALELIRDEHITQFNGAPSMVLQLLELPDFDRAGAARSLGGLGFGGAGMPQRLIDQVGRHMASTMTGIGFGLTETNGVGAAASGMLFEQSPHAAGAVSPLMECRIADEQGQSLPAGQAGEIWLRGVSLMQGYWQQPEATARALQGGWFRTGDVGMLDEHGLLRVVDRIKDVINRNGEKIAAAEVESCLMMHPEVLEVAVYGVPDATTGEAVVAEVVPRPGSQPEPEELRRHAAQHLAAYKVPLHVLLRTEPLPRNPAGKSLKPPLREAFLQHLAA
jgi:long-chain acyl-CoA synthetase